MKNRELNIYVCINNIKQQLIQYKNTMVNFIIRDLKEIPMMTSTMIIVMHLKKKTREVDLVLIKKIKYLSYLIPIESDEYLAIFITFYWY